MKLLLTSNGFMGTSLEKDFLELVGDRKNLKVAIITTASDPIEWVPEKEGSKVYIAKLVPEKKGENIKWQNSYKEEWEKKGYHVIIVDLKEDPTEIEKKLENVGIIDVTGGDVNWLLDWAKKANLGAYLKDLLAKGIVYVGSSAGCGLVTPDIGLTWWEPEKWTGTDHIGFGVVDFVVVPHQKEDDSQKSIANLTERKKYMQSVTEFPWKVYLLQDGQAIKVDGGNIEHIGPGTKASI